MSETASAPTDTKNKDWGPDEHLALTAFFPQEITQITPDYQISFKDEVDLSPFETAKILTPEEMEQYLFVVVPTSSWNAMHEAYTKMELSQASDVAEKGRLVIRGSGRAYKIPVSDIIVDPEYTAKEPLENPLKFIRITLKLLIQIDQEKMDFVNTVRWGDAPVDPIHYPFIMLTQVCWNAFQKYIDARGIRLTLRQQARPVAIKINKKNIFRTTTERFEKMKARKDIK